MSFFQDDPGPEVTPSDQQAEDLGEPVVEAEAENNDTEPSPEEKLANELALIPDFADVYDPATTIRSKGVVVRTAIIKSLQNPEVMAQCKPFLVKNNIAGIANMAHGKMAEIFIDSSNILTDMLQKRHITLHYVWGQLHQVLKTNGGYLFKHGYVVGNTKQLKA